MRIVLMLIVFVFLSTLNAQPRKPEPLIEPLGKKHVIIDKGITGYMYSIDGQWISAPMKIPARLNSRDKQSFKLKENLLGTDNIVALYMHQVKYGDRKLYVLYKFYKVGYYKYQATQKGWKEELRAYYYVLDDDALQAILNAPNEDVMLKLKLYDSGILSDVKISNVQKKALLQIRVKQEFDRQLIFHIDKSNGESEIRFFFYSQHKIFKDTEGVLQPEFKISGRSYFAQPTLLKFFYYQISKETLENFLKMINPKFKDEEPDLPLSDANTGQD
ncbi:MAG: hypothetical protein ACK4EX_04325 [Thermaurantimonas sp.]|uniref:hypothetical protein n=1 Tax=Thermaurantimonas sp. TaxID=2681568 RepID=UPI00391DD97F